MKKVVILFVFALLALSSGLKAQVFVVESGSTTTTYATIKLAVNALVDGDKLYLPPGQFSLVGCTWTGYSGNENNGNTLAIKKRVSIYGAGYNQGANSTIIVDGTFMITRDAAGTTLTGVRFEGYLTLDNVSNTMITRCMTNNYLPVLGTGSNNYISECEIQNVSVDQNNGIILTKSLIKSTNTNCWNSTISNNIFFYINHNLYNCSLFNNVFVGNRSDVNSNLSVTYANNCSFSYNYWIGANPSSPASYNNTFNNEKVNQNFSTTFVDFNNGDYHLKTGCVGINAGNDGKDVGVYGTAIPFKENRLPAIPYFAIKTISAETDASGKLPVNITVQAQDR